jgi:hypothetical protein
MRAKIKIGGISGGKRVLNMRFAWPTAIFAALKLHSYPTKEAVGACLYKRRLVLKMFNFKKTNTMKRILFACGLAACSFTGVMAQSAQQTNTSANAQQVDPKLMISSKISELDASISRGRMDAAQNFYNELAVLMQDHMSQKQKAIGKMPSDKDREIASKSLKEETIAAANAKMLSADLKKNQKELISTLRTFLQNY